MQNRLTDAQTLNFIIDQNPFLIHIHSFIPYNLIHELFRNNPLDFLEWRALPPSHRTDFLDMSKLHAVPLEQSCEIFDQVQTMLRYHLKLKNPLVPGETKRINQIALCQSPTALTALALLDGYGMIVKGNTGVGKSFSVTRALEVLCPKRVIHHPQNAEFGWGSLAQVIYLRVLVPPNGTISALLLAIVESLDLLLQTSYSTEFLKRVEKTNQGVQGLIVCKWLSNHRIAILVLEEAQEDTIAKRWASLFRGHVLQMMNLGIGVILIGNPYAFEEYYSNSQLLRRIAKGGDHSIERLDVDGLNGDWKEYFEGQRNFCLVESVGIDEYQVEAIFKQVTAGIHGLVADFNSGIQRFCLRRGGDTAVLQHGDLEAFANDATFKRNRELAFAAQQLTAHLIFPDYKQTQVLTIPPSHAKSPEHAEVGDQAERPDGGESPSIAGDFAAENRTPPQVPKYIARELSSAKARATRAANAAAKRKLLEDTLSPEDARLQTAMTHAISELKRLQAPSVPDTGFVSN